MRRRTRRTILIAGAVAALLVASAAALWWLRVPLLKIIPTPPIVITEKDQGRVIYLLQGQRLEVHLPSNAYASSTWRAEVPMPYLPQTGASAFVPTPGAITKGDGYQTMTFTATGSGLGPLFIAYLPNDNQNSYQPSISFSVIVSVR